MHITGLFSFVPGSIRSGGALLAAVAAGFALASAGGADAQTLPALTAAPASLSFTYTVGSAIPASQTLAIKGASSAKILCSLAKVPNVAWLVATPASGTTPFSVVVRPNPTSLSLGVHETDIVITSAGASNSPVTVHVTLTVKSPPPTFTVTPPAVTVNYSTDDLALPLAQNLTITTSGQPVSYTTAVNSAPWLTVTPTSGISMLGSPAVLGLTVNPAGLLPNTYHGKLVISSANAATKSISVSVDLVVSPGTAVLTGVWPPNVAVGSPDTTITLSGSHLFPGSAVHIGTVDLTPTWLGNDSLLVVVPATSLSATGPLAITVTNAPKPASNALVWNVTAPGPRIWTVVNGATYNTPSGTPTIAPGEIISIFGSGMGTTAANGILAPPPAALGAYPTTLNTGAAGEDTKVQFKVGAAWVDAPLTYAQDGQVNAVVPFSLTPAAGVLMHVIYKGVTSADFTVDAIAADPGIFTVDASGRGQAAVLNYNASTGAYTLNSATNPALRGSIIAIYATGGGVTTPLPTIEGELVQLIAGNPPPLAAAGTTVTIGTDTVASDYAGSVPGSIAGLVQINATVPNTVKPGKQVPVLITVGGVTSPTGVTIAVK